MPGVYQVLSYILGEHQWRKQRNPLLLWSLCFNGESCKAREINRCVIYCLRRWQVLWEKKKLAYGMEGHGKEWHLSRDLKEMRVVSHGYNGTEEKRSINAPGVAARITVRRRPEQDEQKGGQRADIQKGNGSQTMMVLLDSLTFTLSQEARLWGILRSKIRSCVQIFDKLMFQI